MQTIEQVLLELSKQLEAAPLYYGHSTEDPVSEAIFVIYHVLKLHYATDLNDILLDPVSDPDHQVMSAFVQKRITTRQPMAYILGEAYFAGMRFIVNESTLIPRSPIAELILDQFVPWLQPDKVSRVLDLCTGGGCIALACAQYMPEITVLGTDLSAEALEVAEQNAKLHHLEDRVSFCESDLFKDIPPQKFDMIVSNPPYVSSEEMATLPEEYFHEPRSALEAADEGLALVRLIIEQAKDYLSDDGVLIVEVGNTQVALEEAMEHMPFIWLEFEYGGHGVFLLHKNDLPG